MASAIICLATNQKFNFLRYILLSLVKNIESGVPVCMFSRFVQLIVDHQLRGMSYHQDIYDNPSFTKKVFANMKLVGTGFSRVITPLFENMLVPAAEEVGQAQDDVSIPTEPSTSKPHKKHKSKKQQPKAPMVPSPESSLEHTIPSPSNDSIPDADKDSLKFQELMDLCTRLSNKVLDLKSKVIDIKSYFTNKIKKLEDRGRMIADMDEDVEVNLEEAQAKAYNLDLQHSEKVLSMQDTDEEEPAEVEEVLEVVTAAKLITEVFTTTKPTTTTAQVPKASAPRRRRGVVIQDPEDTTTSVIVHTEVQPKDKGKAELNENIKWNDVIEQVKRSERQNNAVMRYQALKRKPLTETQTRKNMMIYLKNMAGFKMNFFNGITDNEIRPLFEKHYNSIQAFLEKVDEEVTIQEKEIEEEGNKRQGETLEQEIAKKQMMDKEAEELKRHLQIVSNDDDDVYTEASPLVSKKDQKGRYGLAKVKGWKLFESCGVYIITFTTTQMFLLVEKKYPLIHFTLQQMLNNVRLEFEKESEMSLELLRLVRRQLNEGMWQNEVFE
nr:hypothetical protein [Tanacetum cinerariifolium]